MVVATVATVATVAKRLPNDPAIGAGAIGETFKIGGNK